ncbi:MAG: hypothetical protein Q8R15_00710 [Candidatus Micrarchaeota archaeon]|nr:hypothetical protein [Candidatus Micrarchaeota archaeon]
MPGKTHLEYDVQVGDKNIKILGINHGQPWKELNKKTAEIISERARKQPGSAIYAEGANDCFLPAELVKGATTIGELGDKYAHLEWRYMMRLLQSHSPEVYRDLMKERTEINPKTEDKKRRTELIHAVRESAKKEGIDVDEMHKIVARSNTKRELNMAQIIASSPHKSIIVVMGADHAPLVKKFLENPKLRERYRRLWEKATP